MFKTNIKRRWIHSSVDMSETSMYCVLLVGMLCIYGADTYHAIPVVILLKYQNPHLKRYFEMCICVCVCVDSEASLPVWVKRQWQESRWPQRTRHGEGGEYQRAAPSFCYARAALWGTCTIQISRWATFHIPWFHCVQICSVKIMWSELFVIWYTENGLLAAQHMHFVIRFYSTETLIFSNV